MNKRYEEKLSVMPLQNVALKIMGETFYTIVGYVPMKCFVVNSEKTISKNGSMFTDYYVVFEYRNEDGKFIKNNIEYDEQGNCKNATKISKLFDVDEYEQCETFARGLNTIVAKTKYENGEESFAKTNENRRLDLETNQEIALENARQLFKKPQKVLEDGKQQ